MNDFFHEEGYFFDDRRGRSKQNGYGGDYWIKAKVTNFIVNLDLKGVLD